VRPEGRADKDTMTEGSTRTKLILKNGAEADPLRTVNLLGRLRAMLDVNPNKFQSLLALARGRLHDAAPEHIPPLREAGFLDCNDEIRCDVRDVLLSAYVPEPEPVLVNPFRLQDGSEKQTAEEALQRRGRGIWDLVFGISDEGRERH